MIKRKSLAFKLILYFSGSCSLILLAIFFFNYHLSKRIIKANVGENARNLTLRTVNRIDSVLLSIQKIPENMAYFLENSNMSEEQIIVMLHAVTQENKEIYGSAISFDPYAFKKDRLYYDP
jgi:sigma-B regulation protein RsbU (phosphoserine phosphatase)